MSENSAAKDAAIQLLYDNIASLPSREYGVINLLPFAHDSDQVRSVKRQVCEAVVDLLERDGYLNEPTPGEPLVARDVSIECLACSAQLVSTITDEDGLARVDARAFIAAIATLNPECPHAPVTIEDLRRHMEDEFRAQMPDEETDEEVA